MANIKARTGSQRAEERKHDEAKIQRFRTRKAWFQMELTRQAANRYQMAMDEDYYDGLQYQPDEAAALLARGQNPVVYNEVKPTIDWMIGTERRTRVDHLVTSRSDDSKEAYEDAQAKTKLLKYLSDVNRTPWARSWAFEESVKAGLGWLEVGVRDDESDEPVYVRSETWRNMLYDSLGMSAIPDDDWRYQFRFKEVDLDIAEAYLGHGDLLKKALIEGDQRSTYLEWWNGEPISGMTSPVGAMPQKWAPYDADAWLTNPRERVLLIECWANEVYVPSREGDVGASLNDPVRMRKRVTIMTEYDTLLEAWSPYKHNRFPFVPVWCYRRKKDRAPYGMIRQQRGPQDVLNKQMSKAQWRLSANQIRLEKSALDREVMDEEQLRDEAAAPDAVLTFADGALSGGKVQIREGAPFVEGDLRLAEHNIQAIRMGSGVNGEARGLDTTARSGKAIIAKQEQGSMLTTEPFDNLLLARQIEGELTLSLCEQFVNQPKTFGVPGESSRFDYVKINQPGPNGEVRNDITARQAHFVIGEQPWKQSLAEGAFDTTMELLGQLAPVAPQVVVAILDLVFEMHPNLPKRETILQRVRGVTGQNAPGEEDTPEQKAAKAQQQAIAQAQFQAQMAQMQAAIKEAQAKGEKLDAEAMAKRLESLYMAAQGAQVLAMAPAITPIADELLRSAGFQDKGGAGVIDPAAAQGAQPGPAIPEPQQADGAMAGIETQAADGLQPGVM
jgi:hypothetical protein